MAILEKKLDRPSGTLGCPIDELARMLGTWYVLGGGRSVTWALQAHCGVKKRLSAWPQNRGCGKLKKHTPVRLEGVKMYPSSVSHFFTGRERFVLFCFVWLATVTLGVPVLASGTAAGTFRRVVEAPLSRPSSLMVERGALSTEVPPSP